MSAVGVCGASPLAAPAGLPLRSAPRRAQRAASAHRASNERATSAELVRTSLARPSFGSVGRVGRVVRVGRSAVGRVVRVGRVGRSGRSAVGRSGRAVRSPAPIGTARGGRPVRARRPFRGGALGGTRVGPAAAGAGVGRAFATPRGLGGRSAANPCARRPAAVRAGGAAALLRRWRRRGPFGASLTARHRPRLVSGRSARAPAAGSPCSGLAATHSPQAASGGYGTAPPQPPPRQFRRTAPSSDPPRRSGRTAKGTPSAVAADGPLSRCPQPHSRRHAVAGRSSPWRLAVLAGELMSSMAILIGEHMSSMAILIGEHMSSMVVTFLWCILCVHRIARDLVFI